MWLWLLGFLFIAVIAWAVPQETEASMADERRGWFYHDGSWWYPRLDASLLRLDVVALFELHRWAWNGRWWVHQPDKFGGEGVWVRVDGVRTRFICAMHCKECFRSDVRL
jgi:hypothetical protein